MVPKTSAITATAAAKFLTAPAVATVPNTSAITATAAERQDVSVPKNGTNIGDSGGGVSYDNDRGFDGAEDCDNYGDSGGEFFTATAVVAAVAITQDATRAAMSGDKDSGGDRGGRGNSDNPRRDEGVDADWKAITTVVVVAMVADAALDAMLQNTVTITATAAETFLMATAVVAVDAMVRKTR
ncbi:hypothetical protein Bbelb_429810 [Branchiostoma belcheri]|nr:hypothetical protein Bbelb_429810 [Branchiostoma belcheri]